MASTGWGAVNVAANDPLLRYVGRFDFATPTAPRYGWPGVSIEAAFSGGSVGIRLSEQVNGYANYYDVTIDGGAPQRITSNSSTITQFDFNGLAPGSHSLKLLRRGESFNGATSGQEHSLFHGLVLDDGASLLALPPRPVRRIEVIGDSLSVGYGNEGPGLSCVGTVAQYTNNAKAYGSLVAQTFCAEVHSSAISGHGVASNYGDGSSSPYPLPALFNRALPGSASPLWDFDSWQPDAVVIFLGTNDFSTGSSPPNAPSQAQYVAAYNALIADIRAKYAASDPWIFCLHHSTWDGSAIFDFGPYVNSVVSYQNTTLGDSKVVAVDMDPYAGTACDYHPSVAEDQAMAARLRVAMAAATGWVPGSCPSGSPTPTRTVTEAVSPTRSASPTTTFTGTLTASSTPTRTATPTEAPTPVGGVDQLFCLTLDRDLVPALVNDRKLTLKVDVGTCSNVSVTVDGMSVPSRYDSANGLAIFSADGTSIQVTAQGWTSGGTGAATKALLHDDKGWAHSLTFDDGIRSQYDNAYPLLNARGLRGGLALNASGIVGGNPWNMTVAHAQALRAAGWDIFNHSYSHPTLSCANFTSELDQNQAYFQTWFPGYNVSHVVYPFESTAVSACAGWPPSYILSGEGGGGLNYVDAPFPNIYRLYRNGLYGTNNSAWITAANNAAGNARPTWLITITHSLAAGPAAPSDAYSTNGDTLGSYLDAVLAAYGPAGDNSLWFAPAGEVYDYTLTRDHAVVFSHACGSPPTASPTRTATATRTPSPSATPSRTLSSTPSASPSPVPAMPSATATPSAVVTPSPTASPTPAAAATSTPIPAEGNLKVLRAQAWPQPNPQSIRVQLEGSADKVELRIYSAAMTTLAQIEAPGRSGAGWVSVPLIGTALPNGICFYEVKAWRAEKASGGLTGKLVVLK